MEHNNDALLTVSVLVTREEYSAAAAHMRRRKYADGFSPALLGGTMLGILAVVGMFFGEGIGFTLPSAICLLAAGVFLLCYDMIFAPMIAGVSAAREYDERTDLKMAGYYEFYTDKIVVRTGYVTGTLPLDRMTVCSEMPSMFLIRFGSEFLFAVPKRLLEDGQDETMRKILQKV